MTHLIDTLAVFKRGISVGALALVMSVLALSQPVLADSPNVIEDPNGDARVLRTDESSGSPFDPQSHHLPDIVEMRIGAFQPTQPSVDLFLGDWSTSGGFVRFDIDFVGLINPPGNVGMGNNPSYSPYEYGAYPVFGFIEFDADGNEDTGGELDFPDLRYLGNVARLGGMPGESRFQGRVAITREDFDHYLPSGPYVERSGEEFHLALLGEEIDGIEVKKESNCGDPAIFEEGETWVLTGHWLHRAHAFEEYSLQCLAAEGRYMPESKLQFRHSTCANRTTVSLVFPLRNSAHASTQDPAVPTQSNNGCPGDQYSIEEALVDLRFSAENVDPFQSTFPGFQLLADWALETPADMLNPSEWRVDACLGSAYASQQSGSARFVWSDMYPNVVNRDFNGDGVVTLADVGLIQAFIAANDGGDLDDDGNGSNNSIELDHFRRNFCLYDTNYDGYVKSNDIDLLGDMDWNGAVELSDVDDFALGMLNPDAYITAYPTKLPEMHGDLNGDGCLDGRDIQLFVKFLTNQP